MIEFVPKVKRFLKESNLLEKAILITDNVGTHEDVFQRYQLMLMLSVNVISPEEELECEEALGIKLLFLPANLTSLIQLIDQGVIKYLKKRNQHKLLSKDLGGNGTW